MLAKCDFVQSNWWGLAEHKSSHANLCTNCWTPEHVDLAAYLIRHASESRNHPATVDFVARSALGHIRNKKARHTARHTGISHLMQWELFTHEHMVPASATLLTLTDRNISSGAIEEVLEGLSYRANGESGRWDANFKARLPKQSELPPRLKGRNLRDIPVKFYAAG